MNEASVVQKVWNFAHVLRDQGVPYQSYISQISYLMFLKMDDERAGLVQQGLLKGRDSELPKDYKETNMRE
jgi:type I restriction enzyme M protein